MYRVRISIGVMIIVAEVVRGFFVVGYFAIKKKC